MRYRSKKRAHRDREVKEFREDFRHRIGHCELCGHGRLRVATGCIAWVLDIHEICRGGCREKAMDKPYALLLLCRVCHDNIDDTTEYPEARQLAILKRARPGEYSLADYNRLKGYGEHRITEADVEAWANDT